MKRCLLMFLMFISCTWVCGQTSVEKWDHATSTFTSYKYKVRWKLIDDLSWVQRPRLSNSTIFKMRSDDTHILVTLSIIPYSGKPFDPWNYQAFASEIKSLRMMKNAEAERNHMKLKEYTSDKVIFKGLHAIKTAADMTRYYPEYQTTVHSIHYSYFLTKDNVVYNLSVVGLSVNEEEIELFNLLVAQLLEGVEFLK